MEKIVLFCFFICLSFISLFGQSEVDSKEDCNVRNLTLNDENSPLLPYFVDENREGVIILHPFTIEDIGDWDAFVNSIRTDTNITFQFIDTKSSALFDGSYHRFKQFYKGIEVVDGGFTIFIDYNQIEVLAAPYCPGCPPIDPCAEIQMLSSYVYEDIDMPVVPSISQAQISDSLQGNSVSINSYELRLANNLTLNCEYRLVYLVHYIDSLEGDMIAWVDANGGNLLYKIPQHKNKNAPTADYGTQFMKDTDIGDNTILMNNRLRCFDMTGNFISMGIPDIVNFNQNDIPISPKIRAWEPNDADPEIFQLFWMTDQVIDIYANRLGINFVDARVGFHPDFNNARSFDGGVPDNQADFAFGVIDGNSTVEYDVIAHEFGHAVIRQFFEGNLRESASLHEGLAETCSERMLNPFYNLPE
jgi:hypothetical protein